MPTMRRLLERIAPLVVPLVLIGAWEALSRVGVIPTDLLPPFSAVMAALYDLTVSGELLPHLAVTMRRLLLAFAFASVGGTMLGLLIGVFGWLDILSKPIIDVIYPTPKIALLPLILIIFGIGETTFILVGFLTSFFLITMMTRNAVRDVDPILIEAGRNFGATTWRLFARVVFPAALPSIATAWRLGMGLCLIVVIAVEFIAAQSGIGFVVNRAWQSLLLERMYTGLIVAGVLGHAINVTFRSLEERLFPWRESFRDVRFATGA